MSDNAKTNMTISDIINYCEYLADKFRLKHNKKQRKKYAQFFTPPKMAKFMGTLSYIDSKSVSILDPGAGIGILTISLIDALCKSSTIEEMCVTTFERDETLYRYLEGVLLITQYLLEKDNIQMRFNNIHDDFILSESIKEEKFDIVIANPPYFKLPKKHEYCDKFKDLIFGQPNIYTLFMILSSNLLRLNGQMVFITPRSYCSGMYFEKFRSWFLENMSIERIHTFNSRRDNFNKDSVLQENVIIKYIKKPNQTENIRISSSNGGSMDDFRVFETKASNIIYREKNKIIRIPFTKADIKILTLLDSWNRTFSDTDYMISTGPIVDFRNREFLETHYSEKDNLAQLFWMSNFNGSTVNHPVNNNKKQAIRDNEKTQKILLPKNNYILLKRFTSKEQNKRLQAAYLLKNQIKSKKIGLDNKVNYIYKKVGTLTDEETLGITFFLNTDIADRYFRMLNGSTQVNAYDIKLMPFPNTEQLIDIGKMSTKDDYSDFQNCVYKILSIEVE